jgi:hypothetical protein
MKPSESDIETTVAPMSMSFSAANWATLPEPETTQVLPSIPSARLASMLAMK